MQHRRSSKEGTLHKVGTLYTFPEPQKFLRWNTDHSIGAGLMNLGNSCYLNAVIQCFVYNPAFQNCLSAYNHTEECTNDDFCLFCEFQKIIPDILRNTKKIISLPKILDACLLKNKSFKSGREEDAHDFLIFILDWLNENCLNSYKDIPFCEKTKKTTPIWTIFGGSLLTRLRCLHCDFERRTSHPFMDLSIEISNVNSVEQALAQFTTDENLTRSNRWLCTRCKKKRDATKKISIETTPMILLLHLKRFKCHRRLLTRTKIKKMVHFKKSLDLNPYLSPNHR